MIPHGVVSEWGTVVTAGGHLMGFFPAAKLATAVEGFETEQQKQQQSYFVRLGSLSAKLRHRALQHSLGKLQSARHSSQDVLAQLQRTLDLVGPLPRSSPPSPWGWDEPPSPFSAPRQVEQLKQGMDQKLQGGQEKLQQLWLEWSKKQPGGGKDLVPPEVGRGLGEPPLGGSSACAPTPHLSSSPRRGWNRAPWPWCRA